MLIRWRVIMMPVILLLWPGSGDNVLLVQLEAEHAAHPSAASHLMQIALSCSDLFVVMTLPVGDPVPAWCSHAM
eukprot:333161-Rhodomonas_salina.1